MKKAVLLVFVLLVVSSCLAVRMNGRSYKGNGKDGEPTSTSDGSDLSSGGENSRESSSLRIDEEDEPESEPVVTRPRRVHVDTPRGPPPDERMPVLVPQSAAEKTSIREIKRSWNKESCAMCATIFWRMEVELSEVEASPFKIPSCNHMPYGKRSLCRELALQLQTAVKYKPGNEREIFALGHVHVCTFASAGVCAKYFKSSMGGVCELPEEEEVAPKQVSKCIQTYDYMIVYGPSFAHRRQARIPDLSSEVDSVPKPPKAVDQDAPLACSELCVGDSPRCRQDVKSLCVRILSDPEERRVRRMCDRFEMDDYSLRQTSKWTLNSPASVAFRKCEAMRSILSQDRRILVKQPGPRSVIWDNSYDEFVFSEGDRTAAEEWCAGQLDCGAKPFWNPSRCADCMTAVKSFEFKSVDPYALATCDRYLRDGEMRPEPGSISHTEHTECGHVREFVRNAIAGELNPPRLTESERDAVEAHTMTEPDVCAAVSLGQCSQHTGLTLLNFYERIQQFPGVPEPFIPALPLNDVCRLEGVKAKEAITLSPTLEGAERAAVESHRAVKGAQAQEKCEKMACEICLASLPAGLDIDYCETMWMGEVDSWRNMEAHEAAAESKKTLVCRMVQQRLLNQAPFALAFWDTYMRNLCPWKTCKAIGVCGDNHWPDDAPDQNTMPPCPCDPLRESAPTVTARQHSSLRSHSAEPPAEADQSCQNPHAMSVLLENGYDGNTPEWVRRYKLLHQVSDEQLAALMGDPGDEADR